MDTQIVTVAISGAVSLVSAFGSILLKDRLDRRRAMDGRGEVSPGRLQPSDFHSSGSPAILRALAIVIFAVAIGYSSQQSQPVPDRWHQFLTLLPFAAVPVLLWINLRRNSRSAVGYQLNILTLWAGVLAGDTVKRGHIWQDAEVALAGCWLASAVLGLVVFTIFRRRKAAI